jgi:hypothetical protein
MHRRISIYIRCICTFRALHIHCVTSTHIFVHERIAEADMRRIRSQVCVARAPVAYVGAPASSQSVRSPHAAFELPLVGSQAFQSALAFNANISAWNTASVTDVSIVCATFGPARAPRWTCSVGLQCGAAVVRGGAADVRAGACLVVRERMCVQVRVRACMSACTFAISLYHSHLCVAIHAPDSRCIHTYVYMQQCMRVLVSELELLCVHAFVRCS